MQFALQEPIDTLVTEIDDLADLDNEELVSLLGEHGLSDDAEAGDIIMAARAHWFDDEDDQDKGEDEDEYFDLDNLDAEEKAILMQYLQEEY